MTGRLLLAPSPRVTAGLAFGLAAASGLLAVESPLLAVAFSALVLGTLLVVAHPDFATLVVAGLLYSNAAVVAVRFHGIPSFATNFIPLLLVVPIAYHVLVRKQPLTFTSAFPFIAAFGIVQGLSTIDAREPAAAGLALETFLFEGIALYFIVTNAIRSFDTLRRIVWVLLAVGATLGALSILQTATGTYRNDYFGFAQSGNPDTLEETLERQRRAAPGEIVQPRLAGPIGEENRYAQILLVLLPRGLFRDGNERPRPLKRLAGGRTAVTAVGAALALSRGAALAVALMLLVMAARRYVSIRQLAAVVLGFALIVAFIPAYQERVASLAGLPATGLQEGGENAPDGAVRGRAGEMAAAALVAADYPILGVGPGNFPFYYPDYAERVGLLVHAGYREAHSLYLDILAETGAVGLFCFLAAVFVTLRDLNRARRRWHVTKPEIANTAVAFELAVVAQLATGLFLQHSYIRYFWLVMALAGAAAWLALREPGAPEAVAGDRARPLVRGLSRPSV